MTVILDEDVLQQKYIKTVENKLSKNIGLSYRAKQVLDNAYLIYGNIFNEDRFCHSKPFLIELKALNVYQINL